MLDDALTWGTMAANAKLRTAVVEANIEVQRADQIISQWRTYAGQLESEVAQLKRDLAAAQAENENLRLQSKVDDAHAHGVAAGIKALKAEGQACPHKEHHPLFDGDDASDRRVAIYRDAFMARAQEIGLESPENYL